MPFTVSHTIVALPFRRTAVPAAALAVGAMAPDAVLYVPELPPYGVLHSALGALAVSTPVALVALAVWTFGLRWAFTALQPGPVHDRLPAAWDDPGSAWSAFRALPPAGRVRRLALVLGAVIAGVYSHVAWDSFTHRHGWSVARIPVLRATVHGHPVYDLLQNTCSVASMLVLGIAVVLWLRRTAPEPRPRRLTAGTARVLRAVLLAVAVLVTAVGAFPLVLVGSGPEGVLGWAAILAVRVGAVLLVATAVGLALTGRVRTARRARA